MAHFAEIDETSTVLRVIVVNNENILDVDGNESETIGQQFCTDLLGGTWIQTSYNNNFKGRYAEGNGTWDPERGVFLRRKPFPSWVLNETTTEWDPPVPRIDGYLWDEETVSWIQPDTPFPSWQWATNHWEPPVPHPINNPTVDNPPYEWDEATLSWVEVTLPDEPV